MTRPHSSWRAGSVDDFKTDDRAIDNDVFDDEYDDYDDYDDHDGEPADRRWLWVAGVAGVILLIAVIGTVVIVNGGDSTTTAGTVSSRTAVTTPPVAPPATSTRPPVALPPETVTTHPPSTAPATEPAATETAAAPAVDPRTIVYRVTGSRQLFDLVTIIYTDEQGLPRTDVNVALPWTKTVVLNPDVQVGSVTATSLAGQLNCTIADAQGATVAAQSNNTMIATCNR